jgi:TRAP-type uncharacterized transport system substrate-binding protein
MIGSSSPPALVALAGCGGGLAKLLFDKKPELVKVHPEATNLDLKTAQQVTPLELHPGAQRYYQETAG